MSKCVYTTKDVNLCAIHASTSSFCNLLKACIVMLENTIFDLLDTVSDVKYVTYTVPIILLDVHFVCYNSNFDLWFKTFQTTFIPWKLLEISS